MTAGSHLLEPVVLSDDGPVMEAARVVGAGLSAFNDAVTGTPDRLPHLPPYSPELNLAGNVWAYLRGNTLGNRVFDTYEAVVDACSDAWLRLASQPERITAIGTREWACVSQ